jgi:3-hydroxyisobutyrate dehydrogenase-like beta-hydroxyacid dehydrogenase
MSDQTSVKIAFLGLGIMGSEFARTAARRGMQVTGWDRTPARAAALAVDSVRAAKTAAEAAAEADVVVMSTIGVEGTERVSQGTRMKLLFNAWIAIMMEGVAEAAILAGVLGVDLQRFASLVSGGPLVPPWALAKMMKITENTMAETEFLLRWADKDVRLALSAAGEERDRLPMLDTIEARWSLAVERFGGYDLSAIYLALRDGLGAAVR